uniref:Uncharacterized protein n=1 Tax=Anguilla anguilla TaxID=7936 RepID=A0A0E9XFF7_ANGAN
MFLGLCSTASGQQCFHTTCSNTGCRSPFLNVFTARHPWQLKYAGYTVGKYGRNYGPVGNSSALVQKGCNRIILEITFKLPASHDTMKQPTCIT